MRLLGRMGETLVEGRGRLVLDEFGDFQFELNGHAVDLADLHRFIADRQSAPYDGLSRFRLAVTDSSGKEFHCGFSVTDTLQISSEKVFCLGNTDGLIHYTDRFNYVGTEILILVPERHWFRNALTASFPPPNEMGVSRYEMELAGSQLEFEFEAATQSLTISVIETETFPQTYTEGWLSEPLRMLLGQLAFPRVIVRSNPDRAMVMVPQVRRWHSEADHYSLLDPAATFEDANLLFQMYGELLEFVASARDASGNRYFERNPLTRFYEELAQAMRGSRWIMTLALGSAVEGALNLLFPNDSFDETVNAAELESLKRHIDDWVGHSESTQTSIAALKDRAKGAVSYATAMTATKRLRQLAGQKKVTSKEVRAWEKVRHKVAHGNIFSPFSSEENDRLILNLMSLFRRLAGLIALGRNPPSAGLVGPM